MVSTPLKFLWKYFCVSFAGSAYYLTVALVFTENFHGALENCKNHESLAQWIFPHLQYITHQEYGTTNIQKDLARPVPPIQLCHCSHEYSDKDINFLKGHMLLKSQRVYDAYAMLTILYIRDFMSLWYKFLTLFSILFWRLLSKLIIFAMLLR